MLPSSGLPSFLCATRPRARPSSLRSSAMSSSAGRSADDLERGRGARNNNEEKAPLMGKAMPSYGTKKKGQTRPQRRRTSERCAGEASSESGSVLSDRLVSCVVRVLCSGSVPRPSPRVRCVPAARHRSIPAVHPRTALHLRTDGQSQRGTDRGTHQRSAVAVTRGGIRDHAAGWNDHRRVGCAGGGNHGWIAVQRDGSNGSAVRNPGAIR